MIPATPIEPAKPTIPATPIEPAKPVIPATPIEPAKPTVPATPIEPAKPVIPATPIGPSNPVNPIPPVEPPSEVEDTFNMGSTIMQAISWWSEKNDLRRRLGEVRYGSQAGAWVKAFHRKDSADGDTGSRFTQRATGMHVGYDTIVGETGDSRWLVGATFRYANSDQDGDNDLGGASGCMDEYSLKGYFVWMNDAGWYVDPLVQFGWYEHELDGVTNSGFGRFKADYNLWGAGTSVEVGRKIDFGKNHAGKLGWLNGMFVEPQVELSYFYTAGTDYTLSTGMHIDQDKAEFLTGRAGLVVGKKFDYSTDPSDRRYVQVALSGGFTREFLGENTMFYRGTDGEVLHRTEKLDEVRHYYGMVWDWQFRQDMRFYGEVERESGDYYRKDYSVTLGLKYSFN